MHIDTAAFALLLQLLCPRRQALQLDYKALLAFQKVPYSSLAHHKWLLLGTGLCF